MNERQYFSGNLKFLRKRHNDTQLELAEFLNKKSLSSVSDWERGKSIPNAGVLSKIADRYNVSIDDLVEVDLQNNKKPVESNNRLVPIVGKIAAGYPNYVMEDVEGYMALPPDKKSSEGLIYLEVTSDSMDRKFPVGSYVLIDTTAQVENGEIAAVKINGEEATLKQVKYEDDNESVMLIPQSNNSNYYPVTMNIVENEVTIIGKAIGVYLSI